MRLFLSITLLFLCSLGSAQQGSASVNRKIDSLQKILPGAKDSTRARVLLKLAYFYKKINLERSVKYAGEALSIGEKLDNTKIIYDAVYKLGDYSKQQGDYNKAFKYLFRCEEIAKKLKDTKGLAQTYNSLGNVYLNLSEYSNALSCFQRSLKLKEVLKDSLGISNTLSNIGNIYSSMSIPLKAEEYFLKAFEIKRAINDKLGMASLGNNLSILYNRRNEFKKAADLLEKILADKIADEDPYLKTAVLGNLSESYMDLHQFEKAEKAANECLRIRQEIGDSLEIAFSYINIAGIKLNNKDFKNAIPLALKGLKMAKKMKEHNSVWDAYNVLAAAYGNVSDYKNAYEYARLLLELNDTLINSNAAKSVHEMEVKYASEKKESQIKLLESQKEIQNLDLAKKESDIARQRNMIIFSIAMVILCVITLFIAIRAYFTKKRSNDKIQKAYLLIEEHQKEILDSIHYAKRIQGALLANDKLLQQHLPEHFILFKPKDIVAGDFYWAQQKNDWFYVATADCTGHGVPGAFMSLLNISLLNEALNTTTLTEPHDILAYVRSHIIEVLKSDGSETGGKDGMDVVLCAFNFKTNILLAACANNPIWIVRNNEISETKPDKFPVGKHDKDQIPFTLHKIDLQKGDTVYTFTDGYSDQFGGPKGKKFKYKQLAQLLLANVNKPLVSQKELLNDGIENWKGTLEQVDDILLIGIKI